jgi:5-formyltetrahydrofolate cyclo-ligase
LKVLLDAAHVPNLREQRHDEAVTVPVDERKNELRALVRAARRARSEDEREAVGAELAVRVGTVPEIAALVRGDVPGCVTAYASFGTEPRTDRLRALLAVSGVRVLLPVIRDDGGLDWADDADPEGFTLGGVASGIPEPTAEPAAHSMADLVALGCRVVLAPALAVDVHGNRIGKAGGYYDRFLAGLDDVDPALRPVVVAVLHDDEVVDEIPATEHDRPVDAVLTPTTYRRLRHPEGSAP